MSLLGFQQALAEMVMSHSFRVAVQQEPQQALARFALTPTEIQRLQALAHNSRMTVGTIIHRSFRLSMIASRLPYTCTLLGNEQLSQVVHTYWETHPPRSLYYAQEATRFAQYLRSEVAQGRLIHPYLADVLALELALLVTTNVQAHTTEALTDAEILHNPAAAIPVVHPSRQCLRFAHDPAQLLPALRAGSVPASLTQGEYYLLLNRSVINQMQIQMLNPAIGQVLMACDGQRSIAELGMEMNLTPEDMIVLRNAGYLAIQRANSPETVGANSREVSAVASPPFVG